MYNLKVALVKLTFVSWSLFLLFLVYLALYILLKYCVTLCYGKHLVIYNTLFDTTNLKTVIQVFLSPIIFFYEYACLTEVHALQVTSWFPLFI